MNKQKIISCALAAMLSLGTAAALPAETAENLGVAISAKATNADTLNELKAVTGNGKVTLTWNAVNGVSKYIVLYAQSGSSTYSTYKTVSETKCEVTGLTNGTSYDFTIIYDGDYSGISVKNVTPKTTGSETVTTKKMPTPANFKAVAGSGKVTLTWDAVKGVTEYELFYYPTGAPKDSVSVQVKGTSYVVTGLENDTEYSFGVICKGADPSVYSSTSAKPVTNEASADGFIYKTDADGKKYISGYSGKGGAVTLPKGCYVGANAFEGNTSITSITVPEDYYFGDYAFAGCTNLKSVTVQGEAFFGNYSFYCCVALEKVTVEGSLGFIYTCAFENCQNLKEFTVKSTGTSEALIAPYAFWNCYSLKSFDIPENCTSVYLDSFTNCVSLEKLTVPAKTKFLYSFDTLKSNYIAGFYYGSKELDDFEPVYESGKCDGKTAVYLPVYFTWENRGSRKTGIDLDVYDILYVHEKFVPKKLTMVVSKGSDAEAYAKKNGISYTYAAEAVKKLSAPASVKVSKKSATAVSLTWSKVEGADGYAVYKYNDKTGKYEKYSQVKSNKCVIKGLTKNTKYKFKIAPLDKVNGKYQQGNYSKAIAVTTKSK